MLSRLPALGLPMISEGLFFAIRRLRLYAALDDASASVDRSSAERALSKLRPFAAAVEPRRVLSTFSGDRESIRRGQIQEIFGGPDPQDSSEVLDLKPWLGIF
jgi:hypothetical protein